MEKKKMARKVNMNLLDQKIEAAQQEVIKAKKKYDAATALLKELLDKRDALRTKEIMTAVAGSTHSYEEIMKYLTGNNNVDTDSFV